MMLKEVIVDGVLFDMDGTLEDSEPLHYDAYRQILASYGIEFTEQQNRRFTGQTDRLICQWLIEHYRLPITLEKLLQDKEDLYMEIARTHATPLPGVLKVIQALHGWGSKIGVASSSTLKVIKMTLKTLQIDSYIQIIASGEEVPNSKPFPDVFLLGAQRLQLDPGRGVGVEDSENGVASVKSAGLFCIAAPCSMTIGQDHSRADVILNNLDEVQVTDTGLLAGNIHFRFV